MVGISPQQRELERLEIIRKLEPILCIPMCEIQLGTVYLGEDNEVMLTIISPLYKYMTVNERYNAAWNVLQKAWPQFIKKYFVSLTLLSDEEWATLLKHGQLVQQGDPHEPVG